MGSPDKVAFSHGSVPVHWGRAPPHRSHLLPRPARSGPVNWLAVVVIGAAVGFLGGVFGKGGAAVATPLLAAFGVPPFIAVAAPLPATMPSTAMASWAYWRHRLVDPTVVAWSLAIGVPANVAGALASGGSTATCRRGDRCVVAALGLRFLLARHRARRGADDAGAVPAAHGGGGRRYRVQRRPARQQRRLPAGAAVRGGAAPPAKQAFACSLAVSFVLAVPGTLVHAALGHIDWRVVLVFGVASVPLSYVGARLAIRSERSPGAGLRRRTAGARGDPVRGALTARGTVRGPVALATDRRTGS